MRKLGLKTLVFTIFSLCLFVGHSARAAVEHYTFDTAHTQILFFVDHLGFSKSQGEFLKYDGGFTLDTEHPEKSSVDVTIHLDGLDMDHEKWNAHLKSADFFNVEKFPVATFKSTKVERTGEKTASLHGDLTLLGVTKPVVLDVTFNQAGIHPFSGKYVAGFSATSTIRREDWGMTYGLPGIGNEVELRIEVEGIREDG